MKRLGPELKMPDLKSLKGLKPPTFLADLYYDLRDRRLLPLVALVAVAIVAVPFLLDGDSEEPPIPAPAGEAGTAALGGGAEARLTVVEAKPGLRDYRKRLRSRTPTDPFQQRYSGVPAGVQLNSTGESAPVEVGGESSGVNVTEVDGTDSPPDGSAPSNSGGNPPSTAPSGGGKGKGKQPRLIEFVLDVQISRSESTPDGGQQMGEPTLHRRVRPLTELPGKKAPVVTTMGVNLRNGKVVLLVSDDVSSLDGDFKCVARTGTCDLLEIEPGFLLDLVYGPNDVHYRVKVTKIDAVWVGRVGGSRSSRASADGPYRAPLPAP